MNHNNCKTTMWPHITSVTFNIIKILMAEEQRSSSNIDSEK